MDLTNRDVAFLVWLTVIAVLVLVRPGGRKGVMDLMRLVRGKIAVLLLAYAAWTTGAVAIAYALGSWDTSLLNETLAWFAVPGMALLFGFQKAYEGRGFYGRTLLRVIGLTALVEFYVNLGAFDLWVELLLLPAIVLLSAMSAVAGMKPETRVAKPAIDGLVTLLGLLVLVGAGTYLVRNWATLDKFELALTFALPIWLTVATLPFIFLFSLFANYETTFVRLGFFSKDNPKALRRAKLALLTTFGLRNRELRHFAGAGPHELARAESWGEARRIVAFYRAKARLDEAEKDLKAKRLARYAGVSGTDWDGQPLDQREFEDTKRALNDLHVFHAAQHKTGRYREDIMAVVGGLVSKTFPESEIVLAVGPKGRSWWAWRRTVAGWVLGIGAAGGPPDEWTWEGSEPPDRGPGPGTDWTHCGFDDDESA
jgi:hypothetical protein